jgi:hypothetical protein
MHVGHIQFHLLVGAFALYWTKIFHGVHSPIFKSIKHLSNSLNSSGATHLNIARRI